MASMDLISGLPDDVLSHVLYFLPLEDAIKSTLLLKRFRNLWRSFSNLTLDTLCFDCANHSHSDDQKLANIIHHILIYHDKEKIDELYLRHSFFFEYSKNPHYSMNPSPEIQILILEEKRFAGVIDSFVSFAIIKRCKVLTLDFVSTGLREGYGVGEGEGEEGEGEGEGGEGEEEGGGGGGGGEGEEGGEGGGGVEGGEEEDEDEGEGEEEGDHYLQQGYILPTIVYRSIHLTQLTLGSCDITTCDEVFLKSLKLLCFRTVVMSDEAMHKFMVGCPSLEFLSIDSCYGLHNLCCRSSKLERLMVHHDEQYSLTVSNLNVVFLNLSGTSLLSVVILKSSVVDAHVFSLPMMHKFERTPYEGFKYLLQSLDQCQTFRPCLWSLKVLAIWERTNIPCPYFKWERLVLDMLWLTKCAQVGLSTLLRHAPLLRTLELYIKPRLVESTTDERSWFEEYELDNEESYWNEANKANLKNLKIVALHGACITAEPAVIHVAKFLLRNAVALEKMVVSTKKNVTRYDPFHIFTSGGMKPEKDGILTDEVRCFLENLAASPKASKKAKICFK